jgi:hypothetical protein
MQKIGNEERPQKVQKPVNMVFRQLYPLRHFPETFAPSATEYHAALKKDSPLYSSQIPTRAHIFPKWFFFTISWHYLNILPRL